MTNENQNQHIMKEISPNKKIIKKFMSNFISEKKIFRKAFSKRINAQGVDTNTHMITKIIIYMIKITQYQLAENECIFHVTLVQSCNTTASYK